MVSVLFNEPKLLKFICCRGAFTRHRVSVLFNEPKLLKFLREITSRVRKVRRVSVLFNEPKLLKSLLRNTKLQRVRRFSALQRAEIAEIR